MANKNESTSKTDIQYHIKTVFNLLDAKHKELIQERESLEREKEAFETTQKIVTSFKDPVKLNVGGQVFVTSKATLMKEESMLKAMFSGRHLLEKGEDGYFIDRDPKHFGKILNFLRDGEYEISDDLVERRELKREASFYSMGALLTFLEKTIPRSEVWDSVAKSPNVTVTGLMASITQATNITWESACTTRFTGGTHFLAITWVSGQSLMIGVVGNHIVATSSVYQQAYTMVLHQNGQLYAAGAGTKSLCSFAVGSSIKVEVNCDTRTVTWIVGANRHSEQLHNNLQPPFRLCVDMYQNCKVLIDSEGQ